MKRSVFKTFFIFLVTITTMFNVVSFVQASTPCDKYFSEFILFSKTNLNIDELESEFNEIKSDIQIFLTTLKKSELNFEKNIRQLVIYLLRLENFTNKLYILHDNNKSNQLFATFIKNVILQKFDIIEDVFLNPKASSLLEEAYSKRYRSNLDFETIYQIQKLHASLVSYNKLHTYNNEPDYSKQISNMKQDLSLPLSFSVLSDSSSREEDLYIFVRTFRKDINKLIQLEKAYVKNKTGARNIYDYTFKNIAQSSVINSESEYNNLINMTFPSTIYTINKVLSSDQFKDVIKDYYVKGKVSIYDFKKTYTSKKLEIKQELDSIFSTTPYRIKVSDVVYGIFEMLSNMYQLSFRIDPNVYSNTGTDTLFTVNIYNKKDSKYLGDIYIHIKNTNKKYFINLQPQILNLKKMRLDSNYDIEEKYFSTFINLKNIVSSVNVYNGEYINLDSLFNLVNRIHHSVFNLISYHNPNIDESTNKEFNYLLDSYINNVSFLPSFLSYYLKKEDGAPLENNIINSVSYLYTTNFIDMFIYEFLSVEEYVFHYNSYFDEDTFLGKIQDKINSMLEIHDHPIYVRPDFEVVSEYIYSHNDVGAINNTLKLVANIEMLNIMKFLKNNNYSSEAFNQVQKLLLNNGKNFDKILGEDVDLAPFFEMMRNQK